MKKNYFFVLCLVLIICCTACTKNEKGNLNLKEMTVASLEKEMIIGKTTKQEIEQKLGKPKNITKSTDGEIWTYMFSSADDRMARASAANSALGLITSRFGVDTSMIMEAHRGLVTANQVGIAAGKDSSIEGKQLTVQFNKKGYLTTFNFSEM